MQQAVQHEEVGTVKDGTFEITVTPWLRKRFEEIEARSEKKYECGSLGKKAQYEMYEACERKESAVMELLHHLGRTKSVRADGGIHERIRMFSLGTRKYSLRLAAQQQRERQKKGSSATRTPRRELVDA